VRVHSAQTAALAILALCVAACSGGSASLPDKEYRIIAHSTTTDEYVIIFSQREGEHRIVTEIVGPCAYYQWSQQPPWRGRHCNLSVGAIYRPNAQRPRVPGEERVDVVLWRHLLVLQRGEGLDQMTNAIAIQSETFVRMEDAGRT
jgi:hypothetical protein